MTKNILVYGATGMLGQALMREASKLGINVVGAARSGTHFSLDVCDDKALRDSINLVKPEIIINTVAITNLINCENNPGLAYQVNARSVGIMAECCQKIGAYFIQISTDHYFTNSRNAKHSETDQVSLVNEYTRTKYAGEKFALVYPNSLVVRTNIVGFRGKTGFPTFLEWVMQTLERQTSFTLFDDFFTSSIDVKQFSSLLFSLLNKRPNQVLNLASREVFSKKKFIEAIAAKLGYTLSHAKTGSVLELSDVPRAESLGLDVTKAEAVLGYQLPTMDEVVEQLISEYKERLQ